MPRGSSLALLYLNSTSQSAPVQGQEPTIISDSKVVLGVDVVWVVVASMNNEK